MGNDPRFGASLGAHVHGRDVHFRAYSTIAKHCAARIVDRDGASRDIAMAAAGDGFFEAWLENAGHGTLYRFVLDDRELPDPYARFLPFGVDGPAMVVEARHTFRHPKGPRRPLSQQVIYELHIGTFTTEGTYGSAQCKLRELAALGVTALEIMPVAAFAGTRGWGYDGVAMFAPFAPYGTPDELRAFVDEAHSQGLDVILDVVYNHFGPAGNYLGAYAPEYFSQDVKNAWGDAPSYAHPAMRAYVLDNACMWLESYGFDGLRLDAVHAMVDPSPQHVLRELVAEIRAFAPDAILIGEDDRNDPALITRFGLDAVWADDFHHQLRVTLTGERDGYYGNYEPGVTDLARTIERGWLYEGQKTRTRGESRGHAADDLPAAAFVYCLQNHDQVGNRAFGDRLSDAVDIDRYCMASAVLLFLPMTPMLFMGQEWAASTPFSYFTDHAPELGAQVSRGRRDEFRTFRAFEDPSARERIPDPQASSTFTRSKLRWEERERSAHHRVWKGYRELLWMRRTDRVLSQASRAELWAEALGNVLRVRRTLASAERILVANFGASTVPLRTLGLSPRAKRIWTSQTDTPDGELPASSASIFAYDPSSEHARD